MIVNKAKLIVPLVKNKIVLDVGCIGDKESPNNILGLHEELNKHAKKLVGADNNQKRLAQINDSKILFADAERLTEVIKDVNFEVIVASELIEHLNNPGNFLSECYKLLRPGGLLLLTTPNAFYFLNSFYLLFKKDVPVWPEHTVLFDKKTITELLSRYNFKVEKLVHFTEEGSKLSLILQLISKYNDCALSNLFVVSKKV